MSEGWWFTIAEVSKLYKVTIPYARKMASIHQWRRRRRGVHVEYLYDDVRDWNEARRPNPVTAM